MKGNSNELNRFSPYALNDRTYALVFLNASLPALRQAHDVLRRATSLFSVFRFSLAERNA
jgi:hypothetical protein